MTKVKIRVPATTANLGPGFDIFGMALTLYNVIEMELVPEKRANRVMINVEGEGVNEIPSGDRAEEIYERLRDNDQIVFTYVDRDGNYAGYPWNPNGSPHNIAGICNRTGNVFGMMPHPERVFERHQHPDWTRDGKDIAGDGMPIFKSVLEEICKRF